MMLNEISNQGWTLLILSYAIGGIMSAIWIAKALQLPDPRSFGSKNPGATNMLRSNKYAAALTYCFDICKGIVCTVIPLSLGYSTGFAYSCGVMAVLGHLYPILHNFRGGKGAATYFGVVISLNSMVGIIAFGIWSSTLLLWRNVGLSAIITSLSTPILFATSTHLYPLTAPAVALSTLIIIRHATNLYELIKNYEAIEKASDHQD
ncbi:MAG: glycerol-3-phosphate acyltransferase [Legionellales bacterium]|nr:glycerol-3-phosphate acyltransferase [Legionellales bacterium]